MKIVFLPGMDGTGLLFSGLIQNIPQDIDREVVCLNEVQGVSFRQQAEEIAIKIGSSSVILVAESYSGKIAYELCNILEERVSKVIFIASFISCPCKLAKLAAALPGIFIKPKLFPNWLMKILCFSGHGNKELTDSVRRAISKVGPELLKQRLINIAELEVPEHHQSTQAVYIRPTNDRLVGRETVQGLICQTTAGKVRRRRHFNYRGYSNEPQRTARAERTQEARPYQAETCRPGPYLYRSQEYPK